MPQYKNHRAVKIFRKKTGNKIRGALLLLAGLPWNSVRMNHDPHNKSERFQLVVLEHMDAAYNYARWLTRSPTEAADLAQEAITRAYAAFERFELQNPRAWLFTIIRNTFLNEREKARHRGEVIYLDTVNPYSTTPETHSHETPEVVLQRDNDAALLMNCINSLGQEFREALILKELEGLRYDEIATITGCPIGTVMSRLSRARAQLKSLLLQQENFHKVNP